jgi:hypothetical protein
LGVMLYLMIKREKGPNIIQAFSSWSFGVFVGYLPVLVFWAVVPGFAESFWSYIHAVLVSKRTNIALPFPWPWLLPLGHLSVIEILQRIIIVLLFITIALWGIGGIFWVIRHRLNKIPVSPALVASFFIALPYTHHAFARTDLTHLAVSIPPFLLGAFAFLTYPSEKIKWPGAVLLCGLSLFIMLPIHPGWYCHTKNQCNYVQVAGDRLQVHFMTAHNVTMFNNIAEQHIPYDRTFICAPLCPGAYAMLGRKSPLWNIYATGSQNADVQYADIERIKISNPYIAIIDNAALDGREELRFCNSNSIVCQYIVENFERVNDAKNNPAIYRLKQTAK